MLYSFKIYVIKDVLFSLYVTRHTRRAFLFSNIITFLQKDFSFKKRNLLHKLPSLNYMEKDIHRKNDLLNHISNYITLQRYKKSISFK